MGYRTMYASKSGIVTEEGELLTCSKVLGSEMDFATDADVRGTMQRLANVAAHAPAQLEEGESVWFQPQRI